MDAEIKKYIEDNNNVYLSDDGEWYTNGERDDEYGWNPVPVEWVKEAEGN